MSAVLETVNVSAADAGIRTKLGLAYEITCPLFLRAFAADYCLSATG